MSDLTFPPIQLLADLRLAVLAHSRRRSPKWGFRLAPDLLCQLQPKPVTWCDPQWEDHGRQEQLRFDGLAYLAVHDTASADALRRAQTADAQARMRLKFALVAYADAPDVWTLQYRSGKWSSEIVDWRATKTALLARLETAFTDGTFEQFGPDLMLRPACLYCGKALTDPVSMARWIGPECAGTSRTLVGMFAGSRPLVSGYRQEVQ